MYSIIGKPQVAQKTIKSSQAVSLIHISLVTEVTTSGKRFQILTILHTKLVLLLRVLSVRWNGLLCPGLLDNLNSYQNSEIGLA